MATPRVEGAFSANGTFAHCDGCTLTSAVDLGTGGVHAPLVMASIVCKAIFAALFIALRLWVEYGVKMIYPREVPRGTKNILDQSTIMIAMFKQTLIADSATSIYVVSIIVPETTSSIKALFIIIYVFYVFFSLFAEIWIAMCVSQYIAIRFHVIHGPRYLPQQKLYTIKRTVRGGLGLLVLGRGGINIGLTIISLNGRFRLKEYDLLTGILVKLAIVSKCIYLILSLVYIVFAIKACRHQSKSGIGSLITTYAFFGAIFYGIWAVCALLVHLLATYTQIISPRPTHLISAFTYDLPLFICLLLLIIGAMQPDWFFDERHLVQHAPAEPYYDPGTTGHESEQHKRWARFQAMNLAMANNNNAQVTQNWNSSPYQI